VQAALQFVGHATVYIELDGTVVLTDPVLRQHAAGLVHRHPPAASMLDRSIDAVLISHLHHDHLDLPSLRLLRPGFEILIADRGAALLARHGFPAARELAAGDTTRLGGITVIATRADHSGYRVPAGPSGGTIGFVLEGSDTRVYFAGDTDVFENMRELRPIDIALLPVAGWGPRLGPGHMDPQRAVEALRLLEPSIAIPIHWGSLAPWGLHRGNWSYLTRPAREFAALAQRATPGVDVRVLQPGEVFEVGRNLTVVR
jgi:L-ascorbate metabolism protein UlaG (beta-lactamase superfamily)